MNDEKLALQTLKALGAKDTTSNVQKKNGTTCFTLPTGRCVSEHKTGYIRVNLLNRKGGIYTCLLYTSPSPRDRQKSRMPSSA